jgi:EAL domain-containing protein (putative c-di-GMP-specific phosphodiesterase class I)
MAYQPIVRATDGSSFGHEALVRSVERALPDPGALFSAAEELGRVSEVGRAVRRLVAADLRDGMTCFLNVHPQDLSDPTLAAATAPLAERAHQVVLEVTERAALDGVLDLRERVRELRRLGYRIAVDDLGAGYAGLTSFASLEPDVVKLDMSIVRGADQEPMKRKLIAAMTTLCRDLGILTVAEGIETAAERQVLCDLGCDLLQGFLIGRPQPLAAPRA